MMGRRDWNRKTASLPLDALLSSVVYAGFDGLLLSRRGYADGKLETDMSAKVGEPAYLSSNSRWAFYDLRPYGQSLRATMSEADWSLRQQQARFPIDLKWTGGFSTLEADEKTQWRWCGRRGGLQLANDSETTRTVELSGQLQQFTPGSYPLVLTTGSEQQRLMLGEGRVPFSVRVTIPPRSTREVTFLFEGPLLKTADARELAFQMTAFSAQEEGVPLAAPP